MRGWEDQLRVGVVGLGAMGAPIARNLLEAGHLVTVWNRTRAREEPLAALGAARAASPAGAAAGADLVVTCVGRDVDVEAVVFGPAGIASTLAPGSVLVDCSTVPPSMARDVARRLGYQGALFVDAPVCGEPQDAADATLTVFAGGTAIAVAKAMPVLDAIASQVTHFGPAGAGQAAKAVSQVVLAGVYAGVAEGTALAERLGLPQQAVMTALTTGEADSWVLRNHAAATHADPPGLPTDEMLKDLRIAIGEADGTGVPLDTTRAIAGLHEDLTEHHNLEHGLSDHTGIDSCDGAVNDRWWVGDSPAGSGVDADRLDPDRLDPHGGSEQPAPWGPVLWRVLHRHRRR